MSDKDFVEKAAVKGLSRKSGEKSKNAKKSALPEKGSAEAETHRQAAKAAGIRFSEPDLPQRGGAEAAVHNLAAKEAAQAGAGTKAKTEQGSGFGFLALVLLLPLAVVGGLYAYSNTQTEDKKSTDKTANSKPAPTKSKATANPSPAASVKTTDKKVAATKTATPVKPAKTPAKVAATAPKAMPKADPKIAAKTTPKTDKPHWDYKNTNWASLDASFKTCGTGESQSPINIDPNNPKPGPGFAFNYFPSTGKVVNNGHSVQVDMGSPAKGSRNQLLVNGKAYDLKQFHFHTPSEHTINGRHAPMEAHLVHKNAQGQLAVVSVMIFPGGTNQLIDQMPVPAKKGDYSTSGGPNINPALLLPENHRAFTFAGSLTTPPCTQNVGWVVLQTPVTISARTLAKFQKIMGKNARPVQPINGRGIYASH